MLQWHAWLCLEMYNFETATSAIKCFIHTVKFDLFSIPSAFRNKHLIKHNNLWPYTLSNKQPYCYLNFALWPFQNSRRLYCCPNSSSPHCLQYLILSANLALTRHTPSFWTPNTGISTISNFFQQATSCDGNAINNASLRTSVEIQPSPWTVMRHISIFPPKY